ncbi:MAG: hypothetical protein KC656_14100 [Myxococcales bacterium]|nr:hypothetical protein [Myxococcales bacterium]MCB9668006.1 hypothetical protein [Alphaproteobacteria bacterium]MCB9693493.1 hypothetical protein [Alphaproteobacteria bacterium]
MRAALGAFLAIALLGGCAARVRVEVPASPTVAVSANAIAVVSDNRDCREVADRLAEQLRDAAMDVRPDAPARITVFACNRSWSSTNPTDTLEGRSQAIAAVTVNGEIEAQLVGAAGRVEPMADIHEGLVHYRHRLERDLDGEVARDLAEQIAPVPLMVRRRVYAATGVGSARAFHNLAVAAEREGQLPDALWWAERAQEARPSPLRARYVEELSRRLNREGATPL